MPVKDPLDALFVVGDEVNRELLRDILSEYVRLDEKGRIFPLTKFYSETNKKKIIIMLLSRKALALKTGAEEAISPSELKRLVEIPIGSLNPTLRCLVEEKIADDENSKYRILSEMVPRCAELLKRRESDVGFLGVPQNDIWITSPMRMRDAVNDIMRQGGLDEGKTSREIYDLVLRLRPGTTINALYKVILDLVEEQKLSRKNQGGTWIYRRTTK